ncbi:hypothetical protein ACLQ2P_26245 [Actinomadura citrea]|uniref:hypothetical protein n=1 Tax=Actinomadura citrea TaxID=46158 RepID=UPI003CE47669
MEHTRPPDFEESRSGVSLNAGRNAHVRNSRIAGRDLFSVAGNSVGINGTSLINSSLVIRNGSRSFALPMFAVAGIGAVLLLVLGFGLYGTVAAGSGIDTRVVFTEGASGARKTLESLKKAERSGNAKAWCELAQPGQENCTQKISAAFERAPESYRKEIDKVDAGSVSVSGSTATAMMRFRGEQQGTAHLERSRNRWQLNPGEYAVLLWAGGLYLSIVDAAHDNGPFDHLLPGFGGN